MDFGKYLPVSQSEESEVRKVGGVDQMVVEEAAEAYCVLPIIKIDSKAPDPKEEDHVTETLAPQFQSHRCLLIS